MLTSLSVDWIMIIWTSTVLCSSCCGVASVTIWRLSWWSHRSGSEGHLNYGYQPDAAGPACGMWRCMRRLFDGVFISCMSCQLASVLVVAPNHSCLARLFLLITINLLLTWWSVFRVWWFIVVVELLQSEHAKYNDELVNYGLKAIETLAWGDATNQTRLGELGACAGECFSH